MDKGQALRTLIDQAERQPSAVMFCGDDLGDVAAFDAVRALRGEGVPGLTVFSGSAEVTELAQPADLVVDGPDGVVALLNSRGGRPRLRDVSARWNSSTASTPEVVGARHADGPGLVHEDPAARGQHVIQPHQRREAAVGRPGETGPGPLAGGVGAVHEAGPEQGAERAVIPAGVEVPGRQLRAGGAGQGRLDQPEFPPPAMFLVRHGRDRVHDGDGDGRAAGRVDTRPGRGRAHARDRSQRGQRPARP